jgi:uncharacterized phage protein (TIGR02218 family)
MSVTGKEINPLFGSSLLDPERRICDVLVARLVYGSAVIRIANHEDALYLDVADGDGQQRFEPVPFRCGAVEGGGTMEVDRATIDVPNVEMLVQYGTDSQRTTLGDMVLNGVLDGAELWRYQINLENLGVFAHSRWDAVGAPSITHTTVTIEMQSALGRCVRPCPMTVVQGSCNNGLYDARCGRTRALYTATGTAIGGSRTHLTSALAAADGHYALGEVEFTGGLNVGARRTIGKHTGGGSLFWARQLRFAVKAGDFFTVAPGCDKTWDSCLNKFDLEAPGINEERYRGMPNIPPPEVMIA